MATLSSTVRIIPYEPRFDGPLRELEESQSYSKFAGFVSFRERFTGTFIQGAKQFDDYKTLVAMFEDELCGTVTIGIREAYIEKQKCQIGHIFGVRVSAKYQRKGLGRTLMQKIEEWAREQKIHTIYLQVSMRNSGAVGLYSKIGYNTSSIRYHSSEVIPPNLKPRKSAELEFMKLDAEMAATLTEKFYEKTDLFPTNLRELFEETGHIGTYLMRDNKNLEIANYLGVSLWYYENTSMVIDKIFVPIQYYNSPMFTFIFNFFFMMALMACYGVGCYFLYFGQNLFGAVGIVIGGLLNWLYLMIQNYLVASRARNIRIYAPFTKGKEHILKNMGPYFKALLFQDLKNIGYDSVTINVSDMDSMNSFWPLKRKDTSRFFQKRINDEEGMIYNFDADCFYDPRVFK